MSTFVPRSVVILSERAAGNHHRPRRGASPALRMEGAPAAVVLLASAGACVGTDDLVSPEVQDRNLGDGTVLYAGHQYAMIPHPTSGSVTWVVGPKTGAVQGVQLVTQATSSPFAAATWQVRDLSDGLSSQIVNAANGDCLEADTTKEIVVLQPCADFTARQKWIITNNTQDGVSFSYQLKLKPNIFVHGGGCIQYKSASTPGGLTLGTCGTTKDASQLFDLRDGIASAIPSFRSGFRLQSKYNQQHVEIGHGNLVLRAGQPTQVLHFGAPDPGAGSFQLTTTTSGHVLTQRYQLSAPAADGSRALLKSPLAAGGPQRCVAVSGASLTPTIVGDVGRALDRTLGRSGRGRATDGSAVP